MQSDAALAAELAREAGQLLLRLRATEPDPIAGGGLAATADRASHDYLAGALAAARPGDPVLSEEAADDPRRLTADRVWIIDPLDGSRQFGVRSSSPTGWRDEFAIHVALWRRGRGIVAAAVALPARDAVFATSGPQRATAVAPGRAGGGLRVATSPSRPSGLVKQLALQPDVELVPMGSVGVKVVAVIEGKVDAYVHSGGQYEWDTAAPIAVARAAGLLATRLDGSRLRYNQPSPWLPDVLVCHPRVAAGLRAMIRSAQAMEEVQRR